MTYLFQPPDGKIWGWTHIRRMCRRPSDIVTFPLNKVQWGRGDDISTRSYTSFIFQSRGTEWNVGYLQSFVNARRGITPGNTFLSQFSSNAGLFFASLQVGQRSWVLWRRSSGEGWMLTVSAQRDQPDKTYSYGILFLTLLCSKGSKWPHCLWFCPSSL